MQGLLPLPGDLVWIRRRKWRVERATRDRHVVRLEVSARDRRLTFLSPFDRVLTRVRESTPRRVRPQEALARLAWLIANADDVRVPSAVAEAAVDILPYQLEPAMAVLGGRTRILLADEVGLGKTIQAGIAIACLARRSPSIRVLILTPASLREQWSTELNQKFRLPCLSADREGLDSMARTGAFGDNPWQRPGIWIGSPDFVKQRHVADSLPRDPWDLLVVDEAHAVCGDSDRYDLCHELASQARRTLLLTATPHSGDRERFSRLMSLGQVAGYAEDVVIFRRTRASLGHRSTRRVRWHRIALSEPESQLLTTLLAFERTVVARSKQNEQSLLLLSVLRKRALSTMDAFGKSLTRRLSWLGEAGSPGTLDWVQPRLLFSEDDDEIDGDERDGLTAHTGLATAHERSWLRRLRTLAEAASGEERKIERIAGLLHRTTEPVVIFTEFRDSLDVILRRLRFSRPVSYLYGGQDALERRHHLRQFLDGDTSVLVATDVASQGLNLQARARWVISLDLPWNPARLEQRIGRVDRISQTRSTHLTILTARHDAESALLTHLCRRVLVARRSLGEDALGAVMPPEAEIRAAVLLECQVREPVGSKIVTCRRWRRAATRAAVSLATRRSLAAAWRSPDAVTGTPIQSMAGRLWPALPSAHGSLFVFTVPLFDSADTLIERRVIPIFVQVRPNNLDWQRAAAEILRPIAAAEAQRRLYKASRFVREAVRSTEARARALTAGLDAELLCEEVQPGLFDLRESRAHLIQLAGAARIKSFASDTSSGESEPVRAGEPVLEIVLAPRS